MTVDVLKQYMPGIHEHGIVTDVNGTWSGTHTFSGSVTHSGALIATSTLAVTGATTLSGTLTHKRNVLASSGNTTLTAAMSGSVMLMDSATVDYALPAVGTSDVGIWYDFVVTVASTDQTITAQAADLLTGGVFISSADTPTADSFAPDVSDDLVITTNGSTQGGTIGTWFRLTCISSTRWFVQGNSFGTGTVITPFS